MHKLPDLPCRKCGGDTSVHWEEKREFYPSYKNKYGMIRICHRCGFSERTDDLENKELADELENFNHPQPLGEK